MKLKLTEDGKSAVIQDGKPVYVDDAGKDIAFDAPGTIATISRLNGEAKGHRERAEAAEGKLKAFEGITDPTAAIKALDTVKNLDAKKLVDAGEIEKVKAEVAKALEEKYSPFKSKSEKLEGQLNDLLIGSAFNGSKYVATKIAGENAAAAAEIARALFGRSLKVEDGKVVGYDASGNKLYSKARPGELADAEEAIEMIVETYPHKASILKASGASGGGANNANGGGGKQKGVAPKRADFPSEIDYHRAAAQHAAESAG